MADDFLSCLFNVPKVNQVMVIMLDFNYLVLFTEYVIQGTVVDLFVHHSNRMPTGLDLGLGVQVIWNGHEFKFEKMRVLGETSVFVFNCLHLQVVDQFRQENTRLVHVGVLLVLGNTARVVVNDPAIIEEHG